MSVSSPINATTGSEIWAYDLPKGDAPATRGVEYWPGSGGAAPRIVITTRGGRLIEVSARTGEPVADFGDGGIVNLKTWM